MTTVLDALRDLAGDEPVGALEQWLDTKLAEVERKTKIATSAQPAALDESLRSDASDVIASLGILGTLRTPSQGYEPFPVEAGFQPLMARGFAKLIVRRARRIAKESKRRRPVFDALRFLAHRDRQPRAILPRAKLLMVAWHGTSIIETVFAEAGFDEFEFIDLLKAAVAGQPVNYGRVRQIAALVQPHLSARRGPTTRAASIAHEFCLSQPQIAQHLKRRSPKGRPDCAEYLDALTQATRREFGLLDFDPRPAGRRQKGSQMAAQCRPRQNHLN
jgi:hypothetical protein